MSTIDWNVKNAINRDVERQHLNKILADIRTAVQSLEQKTGTTTITPSTSNSIKDIVGQMVVNNTETGISVTYNNLAKVLDFAVANFMLTLAGDVTGSITLSPGSNAIMQVEIDPSLIGIGEAPLDNDPYWRQSGGWEAVPVNITALTEVAGAGLMVLDATDPEEPVWTPRTIQNGAGIDWTNPDGVAGDPQAVFNADTAEVAHLPGATYKTVQKLIDVMFSPGLISGGDLTELTPTSVRVEAGTAVVRIADDNISELRFFDFPSQDFNVSDVQVTHYYRLEYNSGSPIITDNPLDDADRDTEIPMGAASRADGFLNLIPNPYRVGDVVTNLIQRLDAVSPVQRDASVGGLELGNTATRVTTLTAGRLWSRVSDFLIPAKNSSVDTMSSAYYNGGVPALTVVSGLTQWDNLNYNDTGAGTLVAMGNNKYANLWFFMSFNGDHYGYVYGTAEHNSVGDAANEGVPFFLPQNFFRQYILLGRYIFEKGVDTPVIIESAFETLFTTQAVNDHNLLAGLQGGTAGEYYHFTSAEHAGLLPWSSEDPADYPLITQTITNGDTTHSPSGDAVFDALARTKGYIEGLTMQWVSGTALTVISGAAYIEGEGRIVESTSAIAKTSLSLSASTWYHVYLYLNSGTPDIEIVTTAPVAYSGTARSKTGDTTRRYLGSINTDGSGNIYNFLSVGSEVYYRNVQGTSPFRAVSNASPTTETSASLASVCPVTSRAARIRLINLASSGDVYTGTSDDSASGPPTGGIAAISANTQAFLHHPIDSSQAMTYWYESAPSGSLFFFLDVYGYTYER